MLKQIFVVVFVFSFWSGFSQADHKKETQRLMDLLAKNEGTYQVQIIDSRELPTIPLTLMDSIEAKRDEQEIKYVWLKSNVRVKILSKKEISNPSFQPLERVKYFSSENLN